MFSALSTERKQTCTYWIYPKVVWNAIICFLWIKHNSLAFRIRIECTCAKRIQTTMSKN